MLSSEQNSRREANCEAFLCSAGQKNPACLKHFIENLWRNAPRRVECINNWSLSCGFHVVCVRYGENMQAELSLHPQIPSKRGFSHQICFSIWLFLKKKKVTLEKHEDKNTSKTIKAMVLIWFLSWGRVITDNSRQEKDNNRQNNTVSECFLVYFWLHTQMLEIILFQLSTDG